MDAAAQPSSGSPPGGPVPAGQGAAPKLSIDKFADGGIVCLKLAGTIDESFEGKKLAATVKAQTLILDLADIRKISSFGIREWVDFINAVAKQVGSIVLLECAPKVVDQLNMVANFAGSGKVFSFYAPYRCDYCDTDSRVLLQVDRDWDAIKGMKMAERPCPSCSEAQYFDEDPSTFFSYIVNQDRFELDADVAAFLSSKLNYTVSDAARKLRIDKIIEGRSTYLRLAGDLDGSFPREKLAEGLEGTVILDVAGVGKIEPAGAAEWRGFLQMITPACDAIHLLGVPPGFLEKLTRPEDLGPKAQVVTFTIPYTCNTCATTTGQAVDVEQHYDVLKFATPPEMKCVDCKNPMVCAASEVLLTHLPSLPRPSITVDTRKFIKDVQTRKPEKKRAAGTTVAEVAAAGRGGGLMMAFTAAALTLVLGAGAFFAYRAFAGEGPASAGLGKVTLKSADVRPAWVTSDAPFAASCQASPDGGVSCVGVSSPAPSKEDAEDEARDAALDAVADGIALRVSDAAWRQSVAGIYTQTRAAKLAAYAGNPSSSQARRDVKEARAAVASSLRASAGDAVPPAPSGVYWEEYSGEQGKRYLAFVQFTLSDAAVKRLVESYGKAEKALGATVVSTFPLVAWRHPKAEGGAIVIGLERGPLKDLGLAEQYVILEVGGRAVRDAATFAKVASDEYTRLDRGGGTLELKVQAGDSDPRTFAAPIKAKVTAPAGGPSRPGSGPARPSGAGTGNVNVWDRYDQGTGGRDDPSQ
jgi:anti-anti-sigma regulatory factor